MNQFERKNTGRNGLMMALALMTIVLVVMAATPVMAEDEGYLVESEFTELPVGLEDEGKYYVSETKEITMKDGADVTIFLLKNVQLTIKGSDGTGSVSIYIVPTDPTPETNTLTYDSRSLITYTNETSKTATITGKVDGAKSHYAYDSADELPLSDDTPVIRMDDSEVAEDNDRMYTIEQIDGTELVIGNTVTITIPSTDDASTQDVYTVTVKCEEEPIKSVTFTGPFIGGSPTINGVFDIGTTDVTKGTIIVTSGMVNITEGVELFENGYAILDTDGKGTVHAIKTTNDEQPTKNTDVLRILPNTTFGEDLTITDKNKILAGFSTLDGVSITYAATPTATIESESAWTGTIETSLETITGTSSIIGNLVMGYDKTLTASDGTVFNSAVECDDISINGTVEFKAGLTAKTLSVGADSIVKGTTVTIENETELGFDYNVTFEAIVSMGILAQNSDKSIAFSKDVTITGASTITDGSVTIAKGATMTIGGTDGELTVGNASGTLNILGKITGGTLEIASGGKVSVPESDTTQGIKTHILSTFDDVEGVIQASIDVEDFDGLVKAIEDGYHHIAYTGESELEIDGTFTLNEGYELIMNGKGIAILAGGSMNNKGTITTEGTNLLITVGEDTSGSASFVNNGTILVCTDGTQLDGYFENTKNAVIQFADEVTVAIGDGTNKATFDNDGKLKLGKTSGRSFSISEGSVMNNSGSIDSISDSIKECSITGAGTFNNETDGSVGIAINTAVITGITYTEKIQGDYTQKKTYMSIQHVEVAENTRLQLMPDSRMIIQGTLTISGELIVKGTLIIAAGDDVAAAAELIVNGDIVIEDGGRVIISNEDGNGKAIVNEGSSLSVENGGELNLGIESELRINGGFYLLEGSILRTTTAKTTDMEGLVIGTGGDAVFSGYFQGNIQISVEGRMTLDNGDNDIENAPSAGGLKIMMAADGAELVVDSYLFLADLVITDMGLVTYEYTDGSTEDLSIPGYNSDSITFTFIEGNDDIEYSILKGGFSIKETATSKPITDNKDPFTNGDQRRTQTYSMDLSGTISVIMDHKGDVPKNPTCHVLITLSGALNDETVNDNGYQTEDGDLAILNKGGISIDGDLVLDEQIETIMQGIIDVTGNMDVIPTDAITNEGTLTVTGLLSSASPIDNDGIIHAAQYIITTGTGSNRVTTYNYSTLDAAIKAVLAEGNTADKRVTIIGDAKVLQSVEVPSTVDILFSSKDDTLTIGSITDPGIIMAFKAGAGMVSSAEQVTVFGTLLFEDKEDDDTVGTVSDVMLESNDDEGFRTYTNIHSAIAQAGASDEETIVTVTKAPLDSNNKRQYVILSKNLTIPSNVTLVVGDDQHSAALKLMNGVTLTIDGSLQTGQPIAVENRFANKAMDVDVDDDAQDRLSSTIVVNGSLMMSDPVTYGEAFPVFGAYFNTDKWYIVSNLDYALSMTDYMENGSIIINGPVDAKDVTFVAGEVANTIVVSDTYITQIDNGKRLYSSLNIISMTLDEGTEVSTGSLSNGTISGTFGTDEGSVELKKVSGTSFSIGNDEDGLTLQGVANTVKDSVFSIVSGKVYLGSDKGFTFNGTDYDDGLKLTYDLWVFMTVASGSTAIIAESTDVDLLYVDGTVDVPSGKMLTSSKMCVVNGTISVTEPTDTTTYGTFEVPRLFIGIEIDEINTGIGTIASVTGPVSADVVIIADGCNFDADNLDGMGSTGFYVNDAQWFSAHSTNAVKIDVDTAPVENAILSYWSVHSTGEKLIDKDGKPIFEIEIGKYDRLDANIKTDIYEIILLADEGIADVTIDGKLMEKGLFGNTLGGFVYSYKSNVAAGTHTIKYTLQNGWSGNAVLSVDGKVQGGLTFSTSGTPTGSDRITYDLQLSGIEKSGYVDDVGNGDSNSGNGSGITDYLLIVLIIVVVFLAGIVAMRLLRS